MGKMNVSHVLQFYKMMQTNRLAYPLADQHFNQKYHCGYKLILNTLSVYHVIFSKTSCVLSIERSLAWCEPGGVWEL